MEDDGRVQRGQEPWRPAVESGDLSQLQDLVQERGLVVLTQNYVNVFYNAAETTPLLEAVERQQMDMVRYLVEECPSVVTVQASSDEGYISLHFATQEENVELMRYLLEKGNDVNAVTIYGETPLHIAVRMELVDIAKFLIDTGLCNLDLETIDRIEWGNATALSMAVGYCIDDWNENLEIVRYIMEQGHWTDEEKADRVTKVLLAPFDRGNVEIAKYLVESCRADVHAHGVECYDGLTPLIVACRRGCLELVQYLVETWRVNVEAYSSGSSSYWRMNPLLQACKSGHLDIIQYLIEKCGADIETAQGGYTNATALHWAITSGKLDVVQYLVDKCPASVKAANEDGETVLHAAIKSGKFDVVKCLVETGLVDIEARDKKGNTALHEAVQCERLDIVQHLVEKCGSDVEATKGDRCTALHMACHSSGADATAMVKYFVDACNANVNVPTNQGRTALHVACQVRNVEMVRCLIQSRRIVNVNAVDTSGCTAMHCCLVGRYNTCIAADDADKCFQIAKILAMVKLTNFEIRDPFRWTILHLACERNALRLVQYLVLECHVDVKAVNNVGETGLHLASREGHVAIVQWLTSLLEVDVNVADRHGQTALHCACSAVVDEERARSNPQRRGGCSFGDESNCCKTVECLLRTGRVNVNAQDEHGKTALHCSFVDPIDIAPSDQIIQKYIQEACYKVVQLLVESGQANVDATDRTGQTVLHYYCSFPNVDIPRYLITQAHANVDVRDNDGRTALHRAVFSAHGTGVHGGFRLVLFLVSRLSADCLGGDDDVVERLAPNLGGRDDGHSEWEESVPKRQRT